MRVWTFLLSCLAVTRGESVAMTSSGTAVFTSEGRLFVATRDGEPVQAPGEVDNFSDVPPTGAVDITFVDLPDSLPADHTNDDANATDDENVTGFPPVDDLTDGARARRAAFAAAMACALVAL